MHKPFAIGLDRATEENLSYRRVLFTTQHMQLVLMSLKPKQIIDAEVHCNATQFIRAEGESLGYALVGGRRYPLLGGDAVIVPPGATHAIVNQSSQKTMQIYVIYSPPQHEPNLHQVLKPLNSSTKDTVEQPKLEQHKQHRTTRRRNAYGRWRS